MSKLGYLLAAAGGAFWIVVGVFAFSNQLQSDASASLAAAAASDQSWYEEKLPGVAGMAQDIIPGLRGREVPLREEDEIPPPPSGQNPSCIIAVFPSSVEYGSNARLQWSSRNAKAAYLQNIGEVPVRGAYELSPLAAGQAIVLSVVSENGRAASCATVIDVGAHVSDAVSDPIEVEPGCVISAHPEEIAPGDKANLSWGASNAVAATLVGFGAVNLQDGTTVSPQTSQTYTLEVRGSDGSSSACSTMLRVL